MNVLLKRFLLLALLILSAALCLVSCNKQPTPQPAPKEEFTPILRFAVTSDVHIRSYDTSRSPQDCQSHEILEHFCKSIYEYSDGSCRFVILVKPF